MKKDFFNKHYKELQNKELGIISKQMKIHENKYMSIE